MERRMEGGGEDRDGKEGEREWRLPGLLYADELVLWSKKKEDLVC